jgi:hypothetical protein
MQVRVKGSDAEREKILLANLLIGYMEFPSNEATSHFNWTSYSVRFAFFSPRPSLSGILGSNCREKGER